MSQSPKFPFDLISFSHLRWNFVFQRPQHLLSRAAANHERVFFFEEPIYEAISEPALEIRTSPEQVIVAVPHLPEGTGHAAATHAERELLDTMIAKWNIQNYVLWYYTPMALSISRHLEPALIVYDCMDELSLFKNAPAELIDNERELLSVADLVFTGGQSLYEAKKDRHPDVHAFPSSIDFEHFSQARKIAKSHRPDPEDQRAIPHPRMGYCGVIDERLDFELVAAMAKARPDWQFVFLGPIVKIDPNSLPRFSNIHYLGQKDYNELPHYLACWDVAMMPFAKNDATRFISPTKTPEYLAAGKPVVSTSIRDVVRPYGELGLVEIADSPDDFIRAAATCGMDEGALPIDWLERVDRFLAQTSWQKTWEEMSKLMACAIEQKSEGSQVPNEKNDSETDFLLDNNASETAFSAEVA